MQHSLEHLHLPSLQHMGRFRVSECAALRNVTLPRLSTAAELSLRALPSLRELRVPALHFVGLLEVGSVPLLTRLEMPSLKNFTKRVEEGDRVFVLEVCARSFMSSLCLRVCMPCMRARATRMVVLEISMRLCLFGRKRR